MSAPRVEQIGDATLYLADCMDVLPSLEGIDAVLTDPPYGIGYQSGHRTDGFWVGDRIHNDRTTAIRDAALQILDGLPALVFGSWKAARPAGTRMVLTWDKGPALGMGALDLPWKPSSEEIYVLGRGFIGARDEGSVIHCPPVQSLARNGRTHPNEKPVALLQRLIRKLPLGTVCDPFMGSGSTGVACAQLGRRFIGIEIEPRYFDIACRRIGAAYKQADLFIPAPPSKPVQEPLL